MDTPLDMSSMFAFNVYRNNPNATFGDYPINVYAHPDIKKTSRAYDGPTMDKMTYMMETFPDNYVISDYTLREYFLTREGAVRTSEQLNELYHSTFMPKYS